jgi:tRNA/tmRNA/rRNA uracil-C5-methylase (TrmA/RlmC/RlmD family)
MTPFDELLRKEARDAQLPLRPLMRGECQTSAGKKCTICMAGGLTYEDEAQVKERALRKFWNEALPATPLEHLVLSVKGRHYRTVSKRKVFQGRGGPELGLIDPSERSSGGNIPVAECAIEPPDHAAIYSSVSRFIAAGRGRELARDLRYVIIKGSYVQHSVILSASHLSPGVTKGANALSRAVTASCPTVTGVFLLEGRSRNDRYYMGLTGKTQVNARRIFGSSTVSQSVGGRSFLFPPYSFSQVNESILEELVRGASLLLRPDSRQTLFDFYCGYGLFGLCLASQVAQVVGVEVSHDSVRSAIANAARQKIRNARFVRAEITGESVARIMHRPRGGFAVLLDPPRGGTARGVIEAVAARRPERAVHIFCNIDLMGAEVRRWERMGYRGVNAIPFDLFPGTSSVEIMILFQPQDAMGGAPGGREA